MSSLRRSAMAAPLLLLLATPMARAGSLPGYTQTNIVSDIPGMAQFTDPNLKNPWGMSFTATSPFWVSNQGTNTASLYSLKSGVFSEPTPPGSSSNFVNIPTQGTGGAQGPTGQVAAGGAGFTIPGGTSSPSFIFATLSGAIEGWVSGNPNAQLGASVSGAVFTGLALASSGGSNYLYAADHAGGAIDVFNTAFANVTGTTFAGKFVDPSIPSGFTPYNIQLLNGDLYVTYATTNGKVSGPGGFVDEYDTSGNLIARLVSDPTGTMLNGPWGIAIAPSAFGLASGDLLVGNFGNATATGGNGTIAAFSLNGTSPASFVGDLSDSSGNPIAIPGLWALDFGNNGSAGSSTTLYFTAGINGQADGLFGSLSVPEPASAIQAAIAMVIMSGSLAYRRARRSPARPCRTGDGRG